VNTMVWPRKHLETGKERSIDTGYLASRRVPRYAQDMRSGSLPAHPT
jgi:hypothetical protein